LTACTLGNISAHKYQNLLMYVEVIATQISAVFKTWCGFHPLFTDHACAVSYNL